MTSSQTSIRAQSEEVVFAVCTRVRAVAEALSIALDDDLRPAEMIETVARAIGVMDRDDASWLLQVAIAGSMPTSASAAEFRAAISGRNDGGLLVRVLAATVEDAIISPDSVMRGMEILTGGVMVDVDFCARYEHSTGIQRVVRESMPRWVERFPSIRLAAWTDDTGAYRALDERERDRVLNWGHRAFSPMVVSAPRQTIDTIVVPWRSTVVLPEVPQSPHVDRIRAFAELSGNRVAMIGYDAIPIVSAFALDPAESERFARYLSIVKHADLVAAISGSSAEEFRGFVDTLPTQGLTGPEVVVVALPLDVPRHAVPHDEEREPDRRPLIICVGSHEPRKNQDAVLYAAERLAADGVDFELVFVGRGNRRSTLAFDRRVAALARSGMHVSVIRDADDAVLWSLFRRARFSVFVSMHEGYGLPVAESLAFGVPVLTSDYGSLAEIASAGGCVMVDPRDDDAILESMRRLLVDDEHYRRISDSIELGAGRGWSDYADDLAEHVGIRA